MLINNAVITGSFIVNGVDVTGITGSSNVSSSYLALSASYLVTSASYASTSASLSIRTSNLEATSSTLVSASSSFAAQSASLSTRLTTDESNYTNLSSSFATTSGSISGRVTTIESKYATTGSNTFTNVQYISSTVNAAGFTTSASLYTDGGLRVGKDSYVSGTAYFNNVVVYGTSSIQYLTSSQVNVGANIINLNTQTPAVRFGGMAVADSGSNAGITGSMLWDSVYNRWIYSNPSGSTYDGGMIISGPRNTTGLGNELGTTACYLMAGQGGDHITSSAIYSNTNCTAFYSTALFVTGSGKIGINTVTPQSTLEVQNGHIRVANNSTSTAYIGFGASDGTTGFTSGLGVTATAHQYEIYDNTNGVTRLKIDNTGAACFSGVVCVGTSLVVQAASTFCNTVGLFGVAPQLYIGGSSGASDFAILQWCATNKSLNIHNQSTGNNNQLVITCEGNVGIACIPTSYKLQVYQCDAALNTFRAQHVNGNAIMVNASYNYYDAYEHNFRCMGGGATYLTIGATGIANFTSTVCASLIDAIGGTSRFCRINQVSGNNSLMHQVQGGGTGYTYAYWGNSCGALIYGVDWSTGGALGTNSLPYSSGIYTATTTALHLGTNQVVGLTIDCNNKVGIGTTSPGTKLEVAGGNENVLKLKNTGGQPALVRFNDTSTSADPYIGSYGNDLAFGIYGVGESMRIDSSRNVGIGFSTVSYKLQVAGEITTHAGTNTSYYSYMNYLGTTWNFGSGEVSDAVNFRICGASASTAGNAFGFWTQPGNATPLLRLKIDKNGYVGINNSCPRASLEVNQACSNVDNGGFMFKTMYIDDNVWTSFFTPPANWAGLTTFNWTGTNDYNRSGAAQIRWSYQSCAAQLGPTTTIFNDSQNAQPCWRYSGGDMQIYINGAGAGKRLQIMIMGSRGS